MKLIKHRAALALAVAAGTLLAAPALAQSGPPPMISVTGEATISVAPDLAEIDGGVTTEARTAREASDANNAAMGKVLLALKGAGIDEKDFQTSRLSLQPQNAPNRTGPSSSVSSPCATGAAAAMPPTILRKGIGPGEPSSEMPSGAPSVTPTALA